MTITKTFNANLVAATAVLAMGMGIAITPADAGVMGLMHSAEQTVQVNVADSNLKAVSFHTKIIKRTRRIAQRAQRAQQRAEREARRNETETGQIRSKIVFEKPKKQNTND